MPVSQMMIDDDLADDQKFDDITLSADNWTYKWTGLPEYKRGEVGKELSYYVLEDDFTANNETNDNIRNYDNYVDGYTHISEDDIVNVTTDDSGKKTFEITITNTQDTKEIFVQKNWENEYAGYGKIVVGAEVVLQRKTENMNNWELVIEAGKEDPTLYVIRKPETSISIKDLPECDAKGIPYLYRAVETRIILSDGSTINTDATEADPTKGHTGAYVYTSETTETEAGFRTDITNRMDTASLKVSKTWSDENDKNKKRPQELKITLKASTVVNGTTTDIEVDGLKKETILNAANNWTDDTTWASVPVYTADGKRIYYTFTEQNITSYKSSYKSVSYGTSAVTGDGTTAARVFTESGQVSEVIFTNSYTDGGNNNGGGGSSGGGGSVRGISRDNPSDSTDDGEVLGANRETPEVPEVLGATRRPQTGDESNMMYYGIGAVVSLAVLAAWFYADKKRKKAAKAK
jgi:LPXTG-motif cell wall-anchored protein